MSTKVIVVGVAVLQVLLLKAGELDLSGSWHVKGQNIDGEIALPGTLAEAGYGKLETRTDWYKPEFFINMKSYLVRERFYRGPATYTRKFTLSSSQSSKPLELMLERVMWTSSVKLDGKPIGSCDHLSVPHVYALGKLSAGEHTLEVTIDNSVHYGFTNQAHGYGESMQSVWHGVVGKLVIREANALRRTRVFADDKLAIEVPDSVTGDVVVKSLDDDLKFGAAKAVATTHDGWRRFELPLESGFTPWNEFHPRLYRIAVTSGGFTEVKRFGFRKMESKGGKMYLNGMPLFIRGDLDCCLFPLTGYPDMTGNEWRRMIEIYRTQGINTMRFHTWTPPQAAFDAADEMGFYMMPEGPYWEANQRSVISTNNPAVCDFLLRELKAIELEYGNSPSMLSICNGNELGYCDFNLLGENIAELKRTDGRHLVMSSTARAVTKYDEFMVTHYYPGCGWTRGKTPPTTDFDYEEVYGRCPIPTVAHEIGQWPVYPDWDESLVKYTGVMRPFVMEDLRDRSITNGVKRFWRQYHAASLKTSRLIYKEEVEGFIRTPSCWGFELLGVRDYTGQGEALVGWFDAFFDAKPGMSQLPSFSDISSSVCFLTRFPKYVWRVGETFTSGLEIRNLSEAPLKAGTTYDWSFAGQSGSIKLAADIAPGDIAKVGEVSVPLTADLARCRQILRFGRNSWDIHVLDVAAKVPVPKNVVMTEDADEMTRALKAGKRVLYRGPSIKSGCGRFKPVYWSTVFFSGGDTSQLGAWFDCAHPALAGFPTDDWQNELWRTLSDGAMIHLFTEIPNGLEPIAMPVPDLHRSKFLTTMFEVSALGGKLLVCGYDLDGDSPESLQLRKSVLDYMSSSSFNPRVEASADWLYKYFVPAGEERRELPAAAKKAAVWIEPGAFLSQHGNAACVRIFDRVKLNGGTYKVTPITGGVGSWRDGSGSYWFGNNFKVTFTGGQAVAGTLYVSFRDPNKLGRKGHGKFEGRKFDIPVHKTMDRQTYVAEIHLDREDYIDGKLELEIVSDASYNLMIDRVWIESADM